MAEAKILAIASGKGGVGKTLCSVNIALCAARNGIKTALIDADPLSNVMELLDLSAGSCAPNADSFEPADCLINAVSNVDVIFPQAKPSNEAASNLVCQMVGRHRSFLNEKYNMVIIDMPAGTGADDSFPYLDSVNLLLMVTNPEPTAHVAAGSFLYQIQKHWKNKPVYLWHNRYEELADEDFDPDDLLGNYNRNVNEEERLALANPIPLAFVPPDPSLDLSKSASMIQMNLCQSLIDALNIVADSAISPTQIPKESSRRSRSLVAYFLRRVDAGESPEDLIKKLEQFIQEEKQDKASLAADFKQELTWWLDSSLPIRKEIAQARKQILRYRDGLDAEHSAFKTASADAANVSAKHLEQLLLKLLVALAAMPDSSALQHDGAFLLFQFAVFKVFSWPSTRNFLLEFRPVREHNQQKIRDRHTQIAQMVGKDAQYQERYFKLVKRLYPVLSRQINHLVKNFGLKRLMFRNKEGKVALDAYIRLFSATVYEMINCGLGIVAGFRFRPSSRAFSQGFENLMNVLSENREDE